MSIKEKQDKLIDEIVHVRGGYAYECKWDDHINALERGIELASDTLHLISEEDTSSNQKIDDHEIFATKILIEELLKVSGIDQPQKSRNYRVKKVYELSCILREKLNQIPDIVQEEEKVTSINSWIKSLRIFKMNSKFISTEYYQSSGDLCTDISKIVLKKTSPLYQKLYVGKVSSLLDEENRKTEDILKSDYELSELVRLTKDNPDFNYRKLSSLEWTYQKALINDRIERGFYRSGLKMLIK